MCVSFISLWATAFHTRSSLLLICTSTIKHPTFWPFGCSQWDSYVNFFSTENERLSSFTAEYRKWVSIILYSRALRITQWVCSFRAVHKQRVIVILYSRTLRMSECHPLQQSTENEYHPLQQSIENEYHPLRQSIENECHPWEQNIENEWGSSFTAVHRE